LKRCRLIAAAVLACACEAPAPVARPAPSAVEPASAHTTSDVPIVIRGADFLLTGTRQIGQGVEVEGTFSAWLGSTPLLDVKWIDDHTLEASVPAGLDGDPLDLTVQGPGGRATLVAAFRASRLASPNLSATLAAPAQVEAGHPLPLSAQVANTGGQAVSGLSLQLQGAADPLWQPGSSGFGASLIAPAAGSLSLSVVATATDDFTGAPVSAVSPPVTVLVLNGPHLHVTPHPLPATVDVGQQFLVALDVVNDGDSDALAVQWSVPAAPGIVPAGLAAPAADVPAGTTRTFSWPMQAAAAGPFTLSASASADDPLAGVPLSLGCAWTTALAQSAPSLSVAIGAPASVSTGQRIAVTVAVTNDGDADANGVVPALDPGASFSIAAAPPPAAVAGHATQSYLFQIDAIAAGPAMLTATAQGTDVNTGATVLAPLKQSPILVQSPASLAAATSAPALVSAQQVFAVSLQVTNSGQATAVSLGPGPVACSGSGGLQLLSQPAAQDLAGGASANWTWTWRAMTAGPVDCALPLSGLDANSGATVGAGGSFHVVVQTRAALSVVSVTAPAIVDRGQTFQVSVVVSNTGEAAAQSVTPSPDPLPATPAVGAAAPAASVAAASIAGGATATFTFSYTENGTGPGSLSFTAGAMGVDANSGAAIAAPGMTASSTVQNPAALSVTSFTLRSALGSSVINRGQGFIASMTVANTGDTAANGVQPSAPLVIATGGAGASTSTAPAPATIAGGSSATFQWTFVETGTSAGTLQVSSSAAGVDAIDGAPVSTGTAQSDLAKVEKPASLTATASAPLLVILLETFTVSLQVTNAGDGAVDALAPATIAIGGAATTVLSGPTPATATLAGHASATFTWTCQANAIGAINVYASASGTDVNDGSTLFAAASTSTTVTEVQRISSDPFADGTTFSSLFDFKGRLYLGPNKSGTGGVRMLPDGSAVESVSFTFNDDPKQKDVNPYGGGASPYPSLGFTGCTRNTAQCGPDNEDGRGIYGSGIVAGTPWLFASGAFSSGSNVLHLYATTDDSPAPDFDYIGVKSAVGAESQGTTAMTVFHDRLYLGFADSKANRPYMMVIKTTPPAPGFDAAQDDDVVNLMATKMPGLGANGPGSAKNSAPVQLIDAFGVFNDRLYLGNNGGWMRSTTNQPESYDDESSDWSVATPSAAAYGAKTSVTTSKLADLLPSDRALPQWAVLNGKLYAARNTTAGPQIWACSPGADGACDPADWALIAANTSGDSQLSQFNDPHNASVSLLAATPTHLYVGFDDAVDGVRLYRSSTTAPLTLSDFQGGSGCSAAAGSGSCPGLGGSGLGVGATRIFDSRALRYGGADFLYVTAGTGSGGVTVLRVPE